MAGIVDSCPQNLTETLISAARLGCGQDKYHNNQYLCLPNSERTGLVEFCHNGIMGILERGYCLETTGDDLSKTNCSHFLKGCPDTDFHINEMYRYPSCLKISTEFQCYVADPSCGNTAWDTTTKDTAETLVTQGFSTDNGVYNITETIIQTATSTDDNSAVIGAIVGSLVAVVVTLLLLLTVVRVLRRRRRQKQEDKKKLRYQLLPTMEIRKGSGVNDTKVLGDILDSAEDNVNDITTVPECERSLLATYEGTIVIQKAVVNGDPADKENIVVQTDDSNNITEPEDLVTQSRGKRRSKMNDTQELEDIVDSADDHVSDISSVPGCERSLLATDEGTTEIQKAVVNGDSAGKQDFVIQADDSNNFIELETSLIQRTPKRDSPYAIFVGDYGVWETKISDHFSTLTDEEVLVLFCFLCSDSGPPDFTDTKWLDMLNVIRQGVFHNRKPVTREEAQETLDKLKSRDYLWEDQDKITEDTKDETMYKIASIEGVILYHISSYKTASVYLRSGRYNRKPGEKCVFYPFIDEFLILRLQMNILTHVTMEDTSIYDMIHRILNITNQILKESEDERKKILMDLRKEGETVHYRGRSQDSVDLVTWLWRNRRPDIVRSCIGLHPHNDIYIIDNKAYRKSSEQHNYSSNVRCLLYCLLLTEKYQFNPNEPSHRIIRNELRQRYFSDITDDDLEDLPDEITETRDGVITFKSDNTRHDVMYAFVTECLVEDSDLEFFLTMASLDVISEYCRSWRYQRSEGERCLYAPMEPEKMYDLFVDKLQLDIITHCTVSDREIHYRIIEKLGVPSEVLEWDQEARERYVVYAKRGTQTVHHARGMIVGCAGAGKTTLLKRLLGCTEEEIKKVKSTEGLEVHEEIFELCDETRSLKAKTSQENIEQVNTTNVDAKSLTFFDFGGQCAYYACHQIYLTRRAFYVVVVDASKSLDQKVDKKVCDQDGSVFCGWTYGDYFVFWIKSIHTYCGSDNQKDTKPVVLIVATHWEKGIRQFRDTNELIESLRQQFPKTSYLPQYIRADNVYCVDFTLPLHDLKTCFFKIASNQRWRESIPKEWSFFGLEIIQKKHKERILKISAITTKVPEITTKEEDDSGEAKKGTQDMLRYYHDAGKALYFNENGLKEKVIIDVQWFIDAFKHIITDKLHFKGILVAQGDWDEYYKTGNLKDQLLIEIWKHKDEGWFEKLQEEDQNYRVKYGYENDKRYLQYHRESLLGFMQRLGLLALGKDSHYVPCMNRREVECNLSKLINNSHSKSSALIYRFDFLPFFLFYRLIVHCMQEDDWNVLQNQGISCLYKNAALFSCMENTFLLSVTDESIQLQVFCLIQGCVLERAKTCKIQERIEDLLNNLAGTFHRNVQFVRGFRCRTDEEKMIAVDIKGHFLPEKNYIPKEDCKMVCPLHTISDQHIIDTAEFTRYWKMERENAT